MSPQTFKAIETTYKGYRFRSRIEARWAVFFDTLSIPYEYEKEGYVLEGIPYLPDFWLPEQECFIEIKGQKPTEEERKKARLLALYTQKCVHTLYGNIEMPSSSEVLSFVDFPASLWTYPIAENYAGGPSTKNIDAPSHLLALLQKLDQASIHLAVNEDGELLIYASAAPHNIGFLPRLLSQLHVLHGTLTELQDTLEKHTEELQAILQPAEGWRVKFEPQLRFSFDEEPAGPSLWCECDRCGACDLTAIEANMHQCNDGTFGTFIHDTPRLIEAYTAARSARFDKSER